MKRLKLAFVITVLIILAPRAFGQQNLDCPSSEAQIILRQMLSSRFAPPAIDQLNAIASGRQTIFSVNIDEVGTLDQRTLYRQCSAAASVNTNGVIQRIDVRYSLFLDQGNHLLLRIDNILR
jgi:hypothetical protein